MRSDFFIMFRHQCFINTCVLCVRFSFFLCIVSSFFSLVNTNGTILKYDFQNIQDFSFYNYTICIQVVLLRQCLGSTRMHEMSPISTHEPTDDDVLQYTVYGEILNILGGSLGLDLGTTALNNKP